MRSQFVFSIIWFSFMHSMKFPEYDVNFTHFLPSDTPILSRRTSESEQSSFKSDITSAENVAINLLKRFNEQRLPKASELEWLVSEQDVPQKVSSLSHWNNTLTEKTDFSWIFILLTYFCHSVNSILCDIACCRVKSLKTLVMAHLIFFYIYSALLFHQFIALPYLLCLSISTFPILSHGKYSYIDSPVCPNNPGHHPRSH